MHEDSQEVASWWCADFPYWKGRDPWGSSDAGAGAFKGLIWGAERWRKRWNGCWGWGRNSATGSSDLLPLFVSAACWAAKDLQASTTELQEIRYFYQHRRDFSYDSEHPICHWLGPGKTSLPLGSLEVEKRLGKQSYGPAAIRPSRKNNTRLLLSPLLFSSLRKHHGRVSFARNMQTATW